MSTPRTDTYFPALTGIRAIAAYMVFLHHYNPLEAKVHESLIAGIINELHIGVTLFFVLSGFLIGFRYSELKNFNFRNYMVNRIARIYPMYFLLTTLTFITLAVIRDQDQWHDLFIYFSNITFLKGSFTDLKYTGIGQGWSLTVEETFYLLAPLIFFMMKKSRISFFLLPVVFVLLGMGLVQFFHGEGIYGFYRSFDFMFLYTFLGRCTEFFVGIGLAVYFKNLNPAQKSTSYFTYAGILGIVINLFILTLLRGEERFGVTHPMGKVVNTLILPLTGIALLYYGLITERSLIRKVLSTKLFVLLGKSSYIFYLIHLGIVVLLVNIYSNNPLVIFIAASVLSVLMFQFIEEPMNRLIRSRFKKVAKG